MPRAPAGRAHAATRVACLSPRAPLLRRWLRTKPFPRAFSADLPPPVGRCVRHSLQWDTKTVKLEALGVTLQCVVSRRRCCSARPAHDVVRAWPVSIHQPRRKTLRCRIVAVAQEAWAGFRGMHLPLCDRAQRSVVWCANIPTYPRVPHDACACARAPSWAPSPAPPCALA